MQFNHMVVASAVLLAPFCATHAASPVSDAVKRGEYLIRIAGCSDCHTPGYGEKLGATPASEWLTGSPVGYRGPWGTSYAANLRLSMSKLTEEQWLQQAKLPRLPPMPFWALKDMSDADLKAIYQFVRSLGVVGSAMPTAVSPGAPVKTPVIDFVPHAP